MPQNSPRLRTAGRSLFAWWMPSGNLPMRRQHAMSMPAGVKSCDTTGWLPHAIRQLGTDRSGGAAVTFCMVLVPLLGFAGFALDYARVSLARVDLQAAVDSAGLAIALLPRTTPIKDVQQRALDRVNASLAGKGLGRITLEATRTGTNISFSASSSVDLT